MFNRTVDGQKYSKSESPVFFYLKIKNLQVNIAVTKLKV